MRKFISVVGARPNFIKIAPLDKAFKKFSKDIEHKICHTGQHFDANMSKVFFDELNMPKPHFYLGISGGSHAQQTARIMMAFEEIVNEEKPDLVIVPGDVNSTMACSLVASKMGIPIAHVESGLRSFDRDMPEEINRIVTDTISDYLFVSEPSGQNHLKSEGIADNKVFFVGNIMIDSLVYYLPQIKSSDILKELKLEKLGYTLATFHRPSNVDSVEHLKELIAFLNKLCEQKKVIFPIHPRTRNNMAKHNLLDKIHPDLVLTDPIGYIDFLALINNAHLVVTDSGGIQEETTYLGIQCITVRENTERPVTVTEGTNQLIGTNFMQVFEAAQKVLNGHVKKGNIPDKWDGKTAERIAEILCDKFT